jgi:hypothetical protein
MAQCVTCGTELHPERAVKYNYCTAPECQEKNLKPLTMVAIGMNKAADELLILDETTREDLATGKYRDQRKAIVSPSGQAATTPAGKTAASRAPARTATPGRPRRAAAAGPRPHAPAPRPWTPSQERLARLYNEQGLRPDEIAAKLGVSVHLATQIILAARNRRKP